MDIDFADLAAIRRARARSDGGVSWRVGLDDFTESLVRVRMLRAFNQDAARYPVFRSIAATVQRRMDEALDDMVLRSGLLAQRLGETALLLHGADVFVGVTGKRVPVGSSLTIEIWARTLARLEAVRDLLLSLGGSHIRRSDLFTIDWHFGGRHGLTSVAFDEAADASLLAEAYPMLGEPVEQYIDRYLSARETVLIVLGPPGTGKTRLVRAILAAMSRRKDDSARVLYTADQKAVESDETFVDFVTGSHDAFVVEDADHLLRARAGQKDCVHDQPAEYFGHRRGAGAPRPGVRCAAHPVAHPRGSHGAGTEGDRGRVRRGGDQRRTVASSARHLAGGDLPDGRRLMRAGCRRASNSVQSRGFDRYASEMHTDTYENDHDPGQ